VLHDLTAVLFMATAGLTVSGIVANLYRLAGAKPEALAARAAYMAIMVVAGPSVLFHNAVLARRKKNCSRAAFWLAAALSFYWSLALGVFTLAVLLALRRHS
jgi:hypothetical protein